MMDLQKGSFEYPKKLRNEALGLNIFTAILMGFGLYFVILFISDFQWVHLVDLSAKLVLILAALMPVLLILLILLALIQTSFLKLVFLNRYSLESSILKAENPLLRKQTPVDLGRLKQVRVSILPGKSPGNIGSRIIYELIDQGGNRLRISVVSSLWPQIRTYCESVPLIVDSPKWWEPLVLEYKTYLTFIQTEASDTIYPLCLPIKCDPTQTVESSVVLYPEFIRRETLILCILGVFFIGLYMKGIVDSWNFFYGHSKQGDIGGHLLGLALFWIVPAYFLKLTRQLWIFRYQYILTEVALEVYEPLFRRKRRLEFDDLKEVRSFDIKEMARLNPACRGHELIAKDGSSIRVSEALPIWLEILKRCGSTPITGPENPWWNGYSTYEEYRDAQLKKKKHDKSNRI